MEKPTILYVDDEKDQLAAFSVAMGRFFHVKTASTGEKGLDLLKKGGIHVVVSDEKMPSMSGTDFLARALEMASDVPRIMLTGYKNEELLIKAINAARLFAFYQKPWKDQELALMRSIQNASEMFHLREALHEKNREIEKTLIDLKFAQEERMAQDRLEHRYRVVNEIAHNLNNPYCAVDGFFQVLQERMVALVERLGKEGFQDKELQTLWNGVWEIVEKMDPMVKRMRKELNSLYRFVKEEGDPSGDPTGVSDKRSTS